MKKTIVIVFGIIFAFFIICCLLPSRPYNFDDCIELGLCAEGLELNDNGKSFVMTKKYCLQSNHIWDNENKVCNVRKFND